KTNVDYVSAAFKNDTEFGPNLLNGYSYQPNKVSGNRYEYVLIIDIPERTPSTTYSLNTLYLEDGEYRTSLYDYFGEERLDLVINIGEGAPTPPTDEVDDDQEIIEEVETPIDQEIIEDVEQPIEPIIEDNLSQNHVNFISIIDNETGQVITNVSFVGHTFDNRLNNVINSINTEYGTAYYIEEQIFIGSRTSYTQLFDYTNTITNDSYEVLVVNTNTNSYPFEDRPFIPSHDLYDNHYVNNDVLMEINIIDPYGSYIYDNQTMDSYT